MILTIVESYLLDLVDGAVMTLSKPDWIDSLSETGLFGSWYCSALS
jgi:hypothetical protein